MLYILSGIQIGYSDACGLLHDGRQKDDDDGDVGVVVHVLERFFGMSHAQSFELMLVVHKKGVAVVGVFSHEIAETKVAQVMDFAQRHQHPLQCTMEKE